MTGRSGRDQKLFKKRFKHDVRNFAFSNRVLIIAIRYRHNV